MRRLKGGGAQCLRLAAPGRSPMTGPRSGCRLCGEALVYREGQVPLPCALCGVESPTNARCAAGHFVCDACHAVGAFDHIEATCKASDATDPVALALALMRSPAVPMHGPEHHFLVPAVLLTAVCNARGEPEKKPPLLAEARARAQAVKGGFCGLWGACGAGVGTGIFASLLTGATPLATESWALANRMTARALSAIADAGGPRCCKRTSLIALEVALDALRTDHGLSLQETSVPCCEWTRFNKECQSRSCRFHRRTD